MRLRGSPERFFFIHVQRTGGSSLRLRLQHHFGEAAVYPDPSDGEDEIAAVLAVEYLERRYRVRRNEIRVITGHFPLCTAQILGDEFTTLTVLREPVQRILSYLSHHRHWTPEDRTKSLEEIYSDPLRFHGLAHNHMVKMFSLTPEEMTRSALSRVEFTPDRLERAKQRIASVDALGLVERFDEFCDELERRFGWDLGPSQRVNESDRFEVPDAFRAQIAEDNAMDIELYEFARRLYGERRAASLRKSLALVPARARS
jgi:hypothetical protein